MKLRNRPILAAVTALSLLTVNGCGELPTAARLEPGHVAEAVVSEGLVAQSGHPGPGGPGESPEGVEIEGSCGIDGDKGGSYRLQNVSLVVPAQCFPGLAQIQVTIPDSAKLEVHLEITPASKNHFDVPVRLEFDARATGRDPRMMVIRWKNPADNQWVDVPTTVDPQTGKVWAELPHFSEYECVSELQGKAGW